MGVDEIFKLENKMNFHFKDTQKDIIKIKEDKEDFLKNNFCRFSEKKNIGNKVRDHCHLTGKYRGPAHSKCITNVKQSQINFINGMLHNFSNFV